MKIKLLIVAFFIFQFGFSQQKENYKIVNLEINDKNSNFGTTFFGEDRIVYSSPKKKSFIIKNVWKGNNQPFLDLFIGDIAESGQLENVKQFSRELNTRYHEAQVTFTNDQRIVYFTRNNYFEGKFKKDSSNINKLKIYKAKVSLKGEWYDVESLPFNNDQYSVGHPSLSADEKTLYFASDMPGSFGKTDIYKVEISEDGSYSDPINLGPNVNTFEREMFPSISGNELYFASSGHENGYGNLDIYACRFANGEYSEPINLGAPINSNSDDFAFIINKATRKGYFSSKRVNGKGDDDIYYLEELKRLNFDCIQEVNGIVVNKETKELLPSSKVFLYNFDGVKIDSVIANNDASFSFELDCKDEATYSVLGYKDTYESDTKIFKTSNENNETAISLELQLKQIPVEDELFVVEEADVYININPIYFDLNKSNIRHDAALELNKVIKAMEKYPKVIIESGSHTDSRGSYKYNDALSSRRARSTVNYIVRLGGIDPARISYKGYGENQLVNRCSNGVKCSDQEHQLNRRTQFKILNPEVLEE